MSVKVISIGPLDLLARILHLASNFGRSQEQQKKQLLKQALSPEALFCKLANADNTDAKLSNKRIS
jgi:plasmid stability protein